MSYPPRSTNNCAPLGAPGTGLAKGRKPVQALGEVQQKAIKQATGEDPHEFPRTVQTGGPQGYLSARRNHLHAVEQVEGRGQQRLDQDVWPKSEDLVDVGEDDDGLEWKVAKILTYRRSRNKEVDASDTS
jgi:hypothetical protein